MYVHKYNLYQDCIILSGMVSVQFDQPNYIVTENSTVQITLVLSRSWSNDLTVQVTEYNGGCTNATRK